MLDLNIVRKHISLATLSHEDRELLVKDAADLCNEVEQLRHVNEERLEALEAMVMVAELNGKGQRAAYQKARNAIAAARGG